MCVFIANNAYDIQPVQNDTVQTVAFQLEVAFAFKKRFSKEIEQEEATTSPITRTPRNGQQLDHQHRALGEKCSKTDFGVCCSGKAFNSNAARESKECNNGCNYMKCGKRKKKQKNGRFVQSSSACDINLARKSFKNVVAAYTDFEPVTTRAIVGGNNTTDVAVCGVYSYIHDLLGNASMTCEAYEVHDCETNEDIVIQPNETVCNVDNPTTSPTEFPCDIEDEGTECCADSDCRAGESCFSGSCFCDSTKGDEGYCCTSQDCDAGASCVFNQCATCSLESPGVECCEDDDCGDVAVYKCEGKQCFDRECSKGDVGTECCVSSDCEDGMSCEFKQCVKKGQLRFTLRWTGDGKSDVRVVSFMVHCISHEYDVSAIRRSRLACVDTWWRSYLLWQRYRF